jgi:succinate dehydrogenase / fumarate reductase membrane anchor subunit
MSLRDPLAKARGLGSAKDGLGHWWTQRLTAVALMLLTPWFVYLALGLIGADQFTVRTTIAQPLNATLLLAFVFALFWHAQLGLQVVVEDYIHGWLELALQIAIKFVYALAALASAIAIGRLVFSV